MRYNFLSLLCPLFIGFATMAFMPTTDWVLFEAEEFGYSIAFPRPPVENNQTLQTSIGEMKLNIMMLDGSKNEDKANLLYMVNFTEYPESYLDSNKSEKLDSFFRNAIDGSVARVNGTILNEKTISLQDYPGRETTVSYEKGQFVIHMRLFVVENKMYVIQTITESNKTNNPSVQRFFNSFKLIPGHNK